MKIKHAVLPLTVLLLAGCRADVQDLYKYRDYNGAFFEDNYYSKWDSHLSSSKIGEGTEYSVTPTIGLANLREKVETTEQLRDLKEYFYSKKAVQDELGNESYPLLKWNLEGNYSVSAPDGVEEYFGATNSLSFGRDGDEAFASGVLSKMYDGRVSCSGFKALSRIQLPSKGFGAMFPLTLQQAKICVLSLRAATNIEGGFGDVTKINFHLTFYKKDLSNGKYIPLTLNVNDMYITTDNRDVSGKAISENGSDTMCIAFDLTNYDVENICALSMTYEFAETYEELYADPSVGTKHYGVMLYELMLPGAKWN